MTLLQATMTDGPGNRYSALDSSGGGAGATGVVALTPGPVVNCVPLNLKVTAPSNSSVSVCAPPPLPSDSVSTHAHSSAPTTTETVSRSETLRSIIRNKLREFFSIPETNTLILQEKTRSVSDFYSSLVLEDKSHFVHVLSEEYGIDHNLIEHLAGQLTGSKCRRSEGHVFRIEERLKHALVPRYQHMFTQFSRLEQGVKILLHFRADIIHMLRSPGVNCDNPAVQSMNSTLYNLINLWMSVGSLRLERITWESPCDLLQRICSYEAVQSIRNWADLRRRVGPHRRCYAFTHSSLPRDPVLVVHVALATSSQPVRNIQSIIGNGNRLTPEMRMPTINDPEVPEAELDDVIEDPKTVTNAIFYSITSTQKGLQGIELGNHLLKRVIDRLSLEFPRIHQYYSLSPIPGFRDWLLLEFNSYIHLLGAGESPSQDLLTSHELEEMSALFQTTRHRVFTIIRDLLLKEAWVEKAHLSALLMYPLMRLCARYLYVEKKRGYAANAVANFHLRNGGVLWRLNWMADTSSRGILGSCGIMVNYRYLPDDIDGNSINYVERQIIPAGDQILEFIRQLAPPTEALLATESDS